MRCSAASAYMTLMTVRSFLTTAVWAHPSGCALSFLTRVQVCTTDCGEAAAAILLDPGRHVSKTYTIAGPCWTHEDAAAVLSALTGRRITYQQTSYDDARSFFMSVGMPDWQAAGLMEMLEMANAGKYHYSTADFKAVTGHDPMTVQDWLEDHRVDLVGVGGGSEVAARSGSQFRFTGTQSQTASQ